MRVLSLVFLALVASCGSIPPAEYPTTPPAEVEQLSLGVGDVIEIVVYNGAKESKAIYPIDEGGKISFQYIGDVVALGKKPAEIRNEVQQRLADGYLQEPIVSVRVTEINSLKLSVSGEVAKDGTIKYTRGMTIVDVIAQSGGFTPMAKKNHVKVIREIDGKEVTYKIPVEAIQDGQRPKFYMAAGDRVFVPERIW